MSGTAATSVGSPASPPEASIGIVGPEGNVVRKATDERAATAVEIGLGCWSPSHEVRVVEATPRWVLPIKTTRKKQ